MIVTFADLAGFTALADVHGDAAAAAILDDFETIARKVAVAHETTLVRTIGDAVLLTSDSATSAMEGSAALVRALDLQDGFPALHIGMHAGDVVNHHGDVIGRAVNLASRIAAAAPPDSVYVTGAVLQKGAAPAACKVATVGTKRLRNVARLVTLFELDVPLTGKARDPVCMMKVDPAAGLTTHRRCQDYFFCSSTCLGQFLAAPSQYTRGERGKLSRFLTAERKVLERILQPGT